ncbi:MAG: hypothetical protein HY231_22835 [Acidobacteria bacterium]|nr:hypothetical protein [Acidobacteriota bacterium]
MFTGVLPATVLGLLLPTRAKASDQPHMREAQEALRKAKRELDDATPDKGGHRNKALRLVNQALEEVERGIKFDNRH